MSIQQASPVQLQDVNEKAFAVVLHYIYTNKLPPFCPSQLLPTVWRSKYRQDIYTHFISIFRTNIISVYTDRTELYIYVHISVLFLELIHISV